PRRINDLFIVINKKNIRRRPRKLNDKFVCGRLCVGKSDADNAFVRDVLHLRDSRTRKFARQKQRKLSRRSSYFVEFAAATADQVRSRRTGLDAYEKIQRIGQPKIDRKTCFRKLCDASKNSARQYAFEFGCNGRDRSCVHVFKFIR